MSDKTAQEKTDELERLSIAIDELAFNPRNPNAMRDAEFNMLCDNIERTGFTDPALVRRCPDGKYRVVGGHHRVQAAKILGFTVVPCTVISDPAFDDEMEEFQLVRHNVIKGKLDPQKFFSLYSRYSDKYGDSLLQDLFGFAEEAEFKRLIQKTAASLPNEMKKKFLEAAAEIKTVDGLASLLNSLFTRYGDTLPYGYMVFDYGGKQSIWVRASKSTMEALITMGTRCCEESKCLDDALRHLFEDICKDGSLASEQFAKSLDIAPKVVIPVNFGGVPTKDSLGMDQ